MHFTEERVLETYRDVNVCGMVRQQCVPIVVVYNVYTDIQCKLFNPFTGNVALLHHARPS